MPSLEDFLPALPPYPPLPRGLFKVTGNPGNPAIYDTTLDVEVEEMTARKREEFRAKGYPPGLIESALLWAREWSFGLRGVRAAFDISPEVGRQVYKGIYKEALALSNRWIESLSQS